MRRALVPVLALGSALLAGCLEVEQYPPWTGGQYDGKPDMRRSQALFHGDRLAWNAHLLDRNRLQDEFLRTERPRRRETAR